jgi:hypothetical protein
MLQTSLFYFEYTGRRKIKWLLNAGIVKINQEYLCIVFNKKNGGISISSSIITTNVCVSYSVPV